MLLTYLCFSLMKRRKYSKDEDDDGGIKVEVGPKIDLPPGVSWPDGSGYSPELVEPEEELIY